MTTLTSEAFAPIRILDSRHGVFRFVEDTHRYYLGDKILPGITGILKTCLYTDPTYYTEESRVRGTNVHKAIQFLNKGTLNWATVIDQYLGYVIAYEKFVKDWNLKLSLYELPLYHPDLLFAGTPDLVGSVLDGVPAIIDIKTGPIMKWVALQTAAQELLVRAWNPDKAMRYRRWGVKLNVDGTYSKPVEFKEMRDEAVFRTLNMAVQGLGDRAETVLRTLTMMTPIELQFVGEVNPIIKSVIENRDLYAA